MNTMVRDVFRYPTTCRCGAPAVPERWGCAACVARHDAEVEAERLRSERTFRVGRRRAMKLPARFWPDPTAEWLPTPALAKVLGYRAGPVDRGRLLGLLGPTGVGKTVAAAAFASSYAWQEYPQLLWFDVPALLRQLGDFDVRDEVIDTASRIRIAVLDDLGAGYAKVGGQAEALLEEIFTVRSDEQRATLFTTNCTPQQLGEMFSDRVIDRMRAWGELYSVPGKSLRRPPGES